MASLSWLTVGSTFQKPTVPSGSAAGSERRPNSEDDVDTDVAQRIDGSESSLELRAVNAQSEDRVRSILEGNKNPKRKHTKSPHQSKPKQSKKKKKKTTKRKQKNKKNKKQKKKQNKKKKSKNKKLHRSRGGSKKKRSRRADSSGGSLTASDFSTSGSSSSSSSSYSSALSSASSASNDLPVSHFGLGGGESVQYEIDSLGRRSNLSFGALNPKEVPAYSLTSFFTRDAIGATGTFGERLLRSIHSDEVAFARGIHLDSGRRGERRRDGSRPERYFDSKETALQQKPTWKRFYLATSQRRLESQKKAQHARIAAASGSVSNGSQTARRPSRFDRLESNAQLKYNERIAREQPFIAVPPLDPVLGRHTKDFQSSQSFNTETEPSSDQSGISEPRDETNRLQLHAATPSGVLQAMTPSEWLDEYVRSRTREHTQQIQAATAAAAVSAKDPTSRVTSAPWLHFVRFQDEVARLRADVAAASGSVASSSSLRTQRQGVYEKQASILRRALRVPGLQNDDGLWLQLVETVQKLEECTSGATRKSRSHQSEASASEVPATSVAELWNELLLSSQGRLRGSAHAWLAYIDDRRRTSDCDLVTTRKLFAEAIHAVFQHCSRKAPHQQLDSSTFNSVMTVLAAYCEFERSLGYSERSLAVVQALFEYQNSLPPVEKVTSKSEAVQKQFFQAFWNSEFPRIGNQKLGLKGIAAGKSTAALTGWTEWLRAKAPQLFVDQIVENPGAEILAIADAACAEAVKWFELAQNEQESSIRVTSVPVAASPHQVENHANKHRTSKDQGADPGQQALLPVAKVDGDPTDEAVSGNGTASATATPATTPKMEMVYSKTHGFRIPMPANATQKPDYLRILAELNDVSQARDLDRFGDRSARWRDQRSSADDWIGEAADSKHCNGARASLKSGLFVLGSNAENEALSNWLKREDDLARRSWKPVRSCTNPNQARVPHRACFFDDVEPFLLRHGYALAQQSFAQLADANREFGPGAQWGLRLGVELVRQAGAQIWRCSSLHMIEIAKMRGMHSLGSDSLREFFDFHGGVCADLLADGEVLLSSAVLPVQHSSSRSRKNHLHVQSLNRSSAKSGTTVGAVTSSMVSRQRFLRHSFHRLLDTFPHSPQLLCAYLSFEWQVLTLPISQAAQLKVPATHGHAAQNAQDLVAANMEKARTVTRLVLGKSPLAQYNLSVWVAYARCEYRYGEARAGEKIFLRALSLASSLPVEYRKDTCLVFWAFADAVLQQRMHHSRIQASDRWRAAKTAVAAFVLCAGARVARCLTSDANGVDGEAIQHDLASIKRLCKQMHRCMQSESGSAPPPMPSPPTMLQARMIYLARLNEEIQLEALQCTQPPLPETQATSLPSVAPWMAFAAAASWLELLLSGIHSACQLLENVIGKTRQFRQCHTLNSSKHSSVVSSCADTALAREEWMRLLVLRLCRRHSRTLGGTFPAPLVRGFALQCVQSFPFNRTFLAWFAASHREGRFQLQVLRLWNSILDANGSERWVPTIPSVFHGVFGGLLSLVVRAAATSGAAAVGSRSAARAAQLRRLRRFLEDVCFCSAQGRESAIAWRLRIAVEIETMLLTARSSSSLLKARKAVRRVFLRALKNCPGSRSIWLDAVRQLHLVIAPSERRQWLEVALRKGTRLHSFPES